MNGTAQQRHGVRTGKALRMGRTHRVFSSVSADSAAGIVPPSEFEKNDLRGRPSAQVLT